MVQDKGLRQKELTELVLQFLPNFYCYKHIRRLDIIHLKIDIYTSRAQSGEQELLCTISGSWDISKIIWVIRVQEFEIMILIKFLLI